MLPESFFQISPSFYLGFPRKISVIFNQEISEKINPTFFSQNLMWILSSVHIGRIVTWRISKNFSKKQTRNYCDDFASNISKSSYLWFFSTKNSCKDSTRKRLFQKFLPFFSESSSRLSSKKLSVFQIIAPRIHPRVFSQILSLISSRFSPGAPPPNSPPRWEP